MKSTHTSSSEVFLPGLNPWNEEADPKIHPPDAIPRTGWWVKRSAKQVTDAAGQPVGFRHQLMHGRQVARTGVGADCARTFRRQAEFLNQQALSA